MGLILEFKPRDAAAMRNTADITASNATILFFTGVRYERWVDEPSVIRPRAIHDSTQTSGKKRTSGAGTRPARRA